MPPKTRVTVVCAACGKTCELIPSRVGPRNFCSKACLYLTMRREAQQVIEGRYNMPIYDLLDHLYNVEQLGVKKIADRLGISDRVCWDWLDSLGVERRSRTEAVRLQWDGNDARRAEQGRRVRDDFVSGKRDPYSLLRISRTEAVRQRNSESKRGANNPMAKRRGPLNPNWKGGKIPIDKYGKKWRDIRAKVRARDNHCCQICGGSDHLQAHHIEPFREQRRHDLDNLITLCASCHGKVEGGVLECPRPKA